LDPLETKLSVLSDGMGKKERALAEIVNITENQGTVLASGLSVDEIRNFIVAMNREKQIHIQTIHACDDMFEDILKEIGPELDAHPHMYGLQVQDLQQRIRRVMDLDVKIRVQEDENNKKMADITNPAAGETDNQTMTQQNPQSTHGPAGRMRTRAGTAGFDHGREAPDQPATKQLILDNQRLINAYKSNTKHREK
jgi:hypothetical protein